MKRVKEKAVVVKRKVKSLMRRFVRKLAAISDGHVMSLYAICPEGIMTKAGNPLVLNEGQKQILESYYDFCNIADELECETVLMGGDMLHGQNPKERGLGLMATDLDTQIDAGVALYSRICKGRKSVWVQGSEYHISTPGHNTEKNICDRIGKLPETETIWAGAVVNMDLDGRIINFSHGGSGAFIYRETAMAREIMFSKVAWANNKLPKIDMFIHGHWHWFSYLHEYDVHFLQLPGWTSFEPCPIFIKNYVRFQPDIGGAIILMDDEGRIQVWHFLYPVPRITYIQNKVLKDGVMSI
jgi:hypothetical protein